MWRSATRYFLSVPIPVFVLGNIIALLLTLQVSRTDALLDKFVEGNWQLLARATREEIVWIFPAEVTTAVRFLVVLRGSTDPDAEEALPDDGSSNPMEYWTAAALASFAVLVACLAILAFWIVMLVLSAIAKWILGLSDANPD